MNVARLGSCEIAEGRIVRVGRDEPGTTTEVGAVNAHTHLYSALAPLGMPAPAPPPQNFVQILERVWWRLDRALDEASLRASARLGIAEALLAGTTTLIDHHESPNFIEGSLDVLADAAQELGARLVTCFGATERNGRFEEARAGLGECQRFASQNRRELVRALVGLHASFTVSDQAITAAGDLCRKLGVPLHVHLAEDRADVAHARRRGHAGPLERLLHLRAVLPGSILAHGVHLDREQVLAVDRAGAWLVQNPRSNEGNQVGYPLALAATERVALGTDGYPSDMRAEARALDRLAREHGDPRVARRVVAGLAIAGERFGLSFPEVPAVGGVADLVLRADRSVRDVVVAGRHSVRDGQLVHADLAEIRARAAEEARRLWKRMEAIA